MLFLGMLLVAGGIVTSFRNTSCWRHSNSGSAESRTNLGESSSDENRDTKVKHGLAGENEEITEHNRSAATNEDSVPNAFLSKTRANANNLDDDDDYEVCDASQSDPSLISSQHDKTQDADNNAVNTLINNGKDRTPETTDDDKCFGVV